MALTGGIGRTPFGVGFGFEIEGFERVQVSLQRFGESIRDWRPFWRDYFAPWFYRQIERNFELEGRLAGGWAPLEERYAAWKAAHFPGKTILRRTDRLFNSLRFEGGQPGPEGIFRDGHESLEVGTSVPYAIYHQRGAVLAQRFISAAKLPRRPFLFLAPSMRSTIGRLMHTWSHAAIGTSGLGGSERVFAAGRFL